MTRRLPVLRAVELRWAEGHSPELADLAQLIRQAIALLRREKEKR